MSYVLTCPNCGPREVTDFGFGGEVNPRPRSAPSQRELNTYNYFRNNVAGVQREWWFHRSGCGEWFLAERDTRTNEVLLTELPAEADAAPARAARRAGPESPRAGREARCEPASAARRRAHRPRARGLLHVRRQARDRPRGRHHRLRAVRVRPPHLLPLLQVPPPARPHVLRRPVPQLPRPGGRRARRARLHGAGARRHEGRAHERVAVARLRRDARDRQGRHRVHPAGLLLQDLHPPAAAVAPLREGAAPRRRPRQAPQEPARARVAHRVPPPSRGRAGGGRRRRRAERRDRRGRAGCRRRPLRRGPRARRAAARRGRPRPRARPGVAGA